MNIQVNENINFLINFIENNKNDMLEENLTIIEKFIKYSQ